MTKALLALGSNLGNRLGYLRHAVDGLGGRVRQTSHVYETPPWPPGYQAPAYLNAAVLVEDQKIGAAEWLELALNIEKTAGRQRDPAERFAPRTLDVDVIMVWDEHGPVFSDRTSLILPHPRAHLRAFVLKPWHDIDPEAELPGYGKISDLLKRPDIAADLKQIKLCSDTLQRKP